MKGVDFIETIPLSNKEDLFAICDVDDYEYLSQFIWTYSGRYAVRSKRRKEINSKNLSMHRIVMNCPEELTVDHINFNKLDNRKENLRIITRRENSKNQPPNKTKPPNTGKRKERLYPYKILLTKQEIDKVEELIKTMRT